MSIRYLFYHTHIHFWSLFCCSFTINVFLTTLRMILYGSHFLNVRPQFEDKMVVHTAVWHQADPHQHYGKKKVLLSKKHFSPKRKENYINYFYKK